MGQIIGRGFAAFAAAITCAFVLSMIGSVILGGDAHCPADTCTIATRLTQIAGLGIVLGFTAFFVAVLTIVPFLVVFVLLVRWNVATAPAFALSGAVFALFFVAFGPPLGEGPMGLTQSEIFRANVTSVVGISGLVIGAFSGLAAWLMDRRLRKIVHA